jgi:hypothetical protein
LSPSFSSVETTCCSRPAAETHRELEQEATEKNRDLALSVPSVRSCADNLFFNNPFGIAASSPGLSPGSILQKVTKETKERGIAEAQN